MADKFGTRFVETADPAVAGATITPGDAIDLLITTRALYVGGAGDVRVKMLSGAELTFANMPVGFHPIRITKVFATGTTATGLVGIS